MTVYVKNEQGINVPVDDTTATGTTTPAVTATGTTTTPPVVTPAPTGQREQPPIGAWSTIDRSIPASFDWSPFTYRNKVLSYADVLKQIYGGYGMNGPGFVRSNNTGWYLPPDNNFTVTGGLYYSKPSTTLMDFGNSSLNTTWEYAKFYDDPKKANQSSKNAYGERVSPLAFQDNNMNRALDSLNSVLSSKLYIKPNNIYGMSQVNMDYASHSKLNTRVIDKNVYRKDSKGNLLTPDIGVTGLSLLDAYGGKDEEKILSKVAATYGFTVDELRSADARMQKAMNQYYNPVTSNWQEVMKSPWAAEIDPAIKAYSGRAGQDLFNKLSKNLPAESPLNAAYYVLHSQPEFRDGKVGKQFKYTDWTDFLPAGVSAVTATPEQFKQAVSAHEAQVQLMQPWKDPKKFSAKELAKSPGGSWFDLVKSERIPIPKGYDYVGSAALHNFNVLANAGINPELAGKTANVFRSALDKEDSGGFLGGFGGLALGALGFAVPALAPFTTAASGILAASQGDILGAALSFANLSGITKSITGGLTDKLVGMGISPETASKLSQAGISGAVSGVSAAMNDGDILKAFATGAAAPMLKDTIGAEVAKVIPGTDTQSISLRNFIANEATNAVIRGIQGQPIIPGMASTQLADTGSGSGGTKAPTGTTPTSTIPKQGDTKDVNGTTYTYNNGIWELGGTQPTYKVGDTRNLSGTNYVYNNNGLWVPA